MTENDLYDKLQALMPEGVQFIDPYLDEVPTPLGDYAQFNVLDRENIGWCQERYLNRDEVNPPSLQIAYDVQRIYTIQIDFYGENAYDYAGVYQQTLQQNMVDDEIGEELCFKSVSSVENRTFLQENKKYKKRYGFDIQCFVVDTITKDSPYFDKIKVRIVNRGNNF